MPDTSAASRHPITSLISGSLIVVTLVSLIGCSTDDGHVSAVRFMEDGGEVTFPEAMTQSDGAMVSFLAQYGDGAARRALKVTTLPQVGTHRCSENVVDPASNSFVINVRYLRGAEDNEDLYAAHTEGTSCEITMLEVPEASLGTWRVSFEAVLARPNDAFNRIVLGDGTIEATAK